MFRAVDPGSRHVFRSTAAVQALVFVPVLALSPLLEVASSGVVYSRVSYIICTRKGGKYCRCVRGLKLCAGWHGPGMTSSSTTVSHTIANIPGSIAQKHVRCVHEMQNVTSIRSTAPRFNIERNVQRQKKRRGLYYDATRKGMQMYNILMLRAYSMASDIAIRTHSLPRQLELLRAADAVVATQLCSTVLPSQALERLTSICCRRMDDGAMSPLDR